MTNNPNSRQAKPAARRRRSTAIAATVVALAFTAASCGSSTDTDAIADDLTEFNDEFNRLAADLNVDAIASLYDQDSLWIEPTSPPKNGQETARQTLEFLAANDGDLSHTIDRLDISDDGTQAVMVGETTFSAEAAGVEGNGTYIYVLERDDDGDWKIIIDMFNQYAPTENE